MRAGKLLLQITIYYLVIGMAIFIALKLWPGIRGYLPVGGVEQLITQPTKNPLQASEAVRAAHVANLGQSIFWLVVAIVSRTPSCRSVKSRGRRLATNRSTNDLGCCGRSPTIRRPSTSISIIIRG